MIRRLGKLWESIRDKREVASVRRGMMKVALGVAVAICCVGVASENTYAAYNATTYGVHNISNPTYSSSGTPYNYIYFGKIPSGNSNYDSSAQGKEIYWRVLNTTSNDGSTPAFFVLTEYGISQKAWDENYTNGTYTTYGQLWSYNAGGYDDRCSTVRGFLNGITAGGISTYEGNGMYQNCFTAKERAAIQYTTKTSETLGCYSDSCNPSSVSHSTSAPGATVWYSYGTTHYAYGSPLEGDYIFLLSGSEAKNSSYGFKADGMTTKVSEDNNRICKLSASGGSNTGWWLRSGSSNALHYVSFVKDDGTGSSVYTSVNNQYAVRGALNIKLASVILTSPASIAGSSSTLSSLASNAPTAAAGSTESTSNASRLTIYDSSRNSFSVYPSSISQKAGNGIVIKYSGMPTTGSDYVSVLLYNSSKSVVYYGRLKSVGTSSGSGWATMTVPSISTGTYTLRVLNEYQETDRKTSYAGYKDITLTVTSSAGDSEPPRVTNVYKNGDNTYYKITANDSNGLYGITNSSGTTLLKDITSLGTSGTANVGPISATTELAVHGGSGTRIVKESNMDILSDTTPPIIDNISYDNGEYVITVTDSESGIWKMVGNKAGQADVIFADYST